MKKPFWLFLSLMLTGLAILCWPEGTDDVVLVKFSENHGPSMLDTIGLVVMAMGYFPLIGLAIKYRLRIYSGIGRSRTIFLVIILFLFLPTIAVALKFSLEPLLWSAVAVCTITQSVLIFHAFRLKSVNH